jgi:hypothetical protein
VVALQAVQYIVFINVRSLVCNVFVVNILGICKKHLGLLLLGFVLLYLSLLLLKLLLPLLHE